MRKSFALFLILITLFIAVSPVEACEPPDTPSYINCDDLGSGYQFGFKLYRAPNGKFSFTSPKGQLTGGAPSDPNNYVQISNSNGYSFNWNASMGIDAVIIMGGSKTKVIKDSEKTGGQNYKGPVDYRGRSYSIEKVEFCYDYELTVSKTAKGSSTRSVSWEITKDVSIPSQVKFAGELARFDYTVSVTKSATGEESGYSVSGEVTVENKTPLTAYITSIKDKLYPSGQRITLDCGDIRFPFKLYTGKKLTCTYRKALDAKVEGENKVYVTTSGKVGGGETRTPIVWDAPAANSGGSETVTVTDTHPAFGGPYSVSDSNSWTYSIELSCPTDPTVYVDGYWTSDFDNTAAIVETDQTSVEKVSLECYAPTLSQTVNTKLAQQYVWSIDKTSPITELIIGTYNSEFVDYTVTVGVADKLEGDFQVSGTINITNPHPDADLTVPLTSEIAPGVVASLLDCASPVTVPAGGTLTCKFEAAPEAKPAGPAVATVTLNNVAFTASTPYNFDDGEKTEIDTCVDVTDDKAGPLGTACVEQSPATFNYTLIVGGYKKCGIYTYTNTATFVTNDTQATGSDVWNINIPIPCETNCVYDVNYWRSHADPSADPNGEFAYDITWDQILPAGPASPFLETGYSWIDTFNGSALDSEFIALAQEYMAAWLNILRGASSDVNDTIDRAGVLLAEYDTSMDAIPVEVITEMKSLRTQLNRYNRGLLGTGPCCE